jgi:uncharacterized protein (DUF427 family)
MSLMIGAGPFGQQPAGRFNREMPREQLLYLEESWRWIRARLGGETVADSPRPRLLHESGRLPVLYFPARDVRMDLLRLSDRREADELKGQARYWSVVVGERVAEDAAWSFDHPQLAGLVALRWEAMDEWLEEDEQAVKHPRDPFHRVDVRSTSRHVRVALGDQVLAESWRTKLLFETSMPPRFYFPHEDVRRDLLVPSEKRTLCAYKGQATHWSVRIGDAIEEDLVWGYDSPLHDALAVRGMLAFYNERVDLEVNGERWERPVTGWSRR